MDSKPETSGASLSSFTFTVGSVLVTLAFLMATLLFLCCYHWTTMMKRALAAGHGDGDGDEHAMAASSEDDREGRKIAVVIVKIDQQAPRDLPVVFMPGEEIPTFVAIPCPPIPVQRDAEKTNAIPMRTGMLMMLGSELTEGVT